MVVVMRRAKKTDNNQSDIVTELRSIPGVTVILEKDDILVGYKGKTYWFEIKNEDGVSRKTGEILDSALRDSQKKILKEFTGHYRIVWSIEQILEDLGISLK
jgi:hypothetical protein